MNKIMRIKRRKITEVIDTIDPHEFDGPMSHVSAKIEAKLDDYKNRELICSDSEVWIEFDYSIYDDDEYSNFVVKIDRLENDKEYNARVKKLMKIKNQERSAKDQEEYEEYQTYLRLKKKYKK
jgi:hypothetical protein